MAKREPIVDQKSLLQQREDLLRMQAQIAMLMREVDEKLKEAGVEASVPDPPKPTPDCGGTPSRWRGGRTATPSSEPKNADSSDFL